MQTADFSSELLKRPDKLPESIYSGDSPLKSQFLGGHINVIRLALESLFGSFQSSLGSLFINLVRPLYCLCENIERIWKYFRKSAVKGSFLYLIAFVDGKDPGLADDRKGNMSRIAAYLTFRRIHFYHVRLALIEDSFGCDDPEFEFIHETDDLLIT